MSVTDFNDEDFDWGDTNDSAYEESTVTVNEAPQQREVVQVLNQQTQGSVNNQRNTGQGNSQQRQGASQQRQGNPQQGQNNPRQGNPQQGQNNGRPQQRYNNGNPQQRQRPQQRPTNQGLPNPNVTVNKYNQSNNSNIDVTQQEFIPNELPTEGTPPKRKSKVLPLVIGIVSVIVLGVVGLVYKSVFSKPSLVAVKEDYNTSGRYIYDNFQNALNNYDATTIDSLVGTEDGDSYIAQEWAYVNHVKLKEEFITKVCQIVKFTYPQVAQLSTTGEQMTDSSGNPIMIESYMNNGEKVTVTIPDYESILLTMDEEKEYIERMFSSSKYKNTDYTWNDEMVGLLLQYLCDKETLPTKEVELDLPIEKGDSGYYLVNDSALDDFLFGSDEFHKVCAKYAQICLKWTGKKDEHYKEEETQPNPEYDEWLVLFNRYYEADDGHFNKGVSKWEPWYLRDENNVIQKDENGNNIVNYYSVKKEDGTDWIQPEKTIKVMVDKVRQVEDPWIEENAIPYNWIGTNFIQNKYQGKYETAVRVGDGSIETPAGIGTSIITKVLCEDKKYHDVKVTVIGYWTGQDAIDYAEKFDTRNRGFTASSVVQLICYEVKIENLENTPIKFNSEMTLCDSNSNVSSRTGTLYGFSEDIVLDSHGSTIINDWATSTEIEQKYVCWGKSFGRSIPMVYFDILAGTGDIPTYSAYKAFTGESSINSEVVSETESETESES